MRGMDAPAAVNVPFSPWCNHIGLHQFRVLGKTLGECLAKTENLFFDLTMAPEHVHMHNWLKPYQLPHALAWNGHHINPDATQPSEIPGMVAQGCLCRFTSSKILAVHFWWEGADDERHVAPVQLEVRGSDSIDIDTHQLMGVFSA